MVDESLNDLAELKQKCKNFKAYSIATDESIDVKDIAHCSVSN
jgi:hypothetical protein